MSTAGLSYLAFVPQHAPAGHQVLAIVSRGDGREAEPLVSLPDAPSVTMLASALNGILVQQVIANQRLSVVLDRAPEPVRKTISTLLRSLASTGEDQPASCLALQLLLTDGDDGSLLLPTTNCPGQCEFCGTCRNDCVDCPNARTVGARSASRSP
jgi:hypothetical protein